MTNQVDAAQLARIIEHIKSKVENKAKHPYHSIKMITNVIKSVADLKKALEKYMIALSDAQYQLLLQSFPLAPSDANKGQIFNFMAFADAIFPAPKVTAVSKHEVFLEGSTRGRGQTGPAAPTSPVQQQMVPQNPASPQQQQQQYPVHYQNQQQQQYQQYAPQQEQQSHQLHEFKADAPMDQSHGMGFEVPNSPPDGHHHLHAPPQIVTVPPSKYHKACQSPATTHVVGALTHKVDHHRDAGHKKRLAQTLQQKPKFTTFEKSSVIRATAGATGASISSDTKGASGTLRA